MSADHDYKQGGWREKYRIFKRCPECKETGWQDGNVPPVNSEIPMPLCKLCDGKGMIRVDPQATYFVLRLDEDPHARVAAVAYAQSIQRENPQLAMDIREKLAEIHKQEFEL